MSQPSTPTWWGNFPPRLKDVLGIVFFCLALGGMLWRMNHKVLIPGEPRLSAERGTEGMTDFRDAVYYPIRAALDGVNPYDCETKTGRADGRPRYRNDPRYPVLNIFPVFSPLILLLFLPVGLIDDFTVSMWCYGTFNIALLLIYSYSLWRAVGKVPRAGGVAALAGIMLLTQPGRANFIAGQLALPLTLALFGALHWARSKPWLSSMALTVASFKPTFGVPLGLLMLFRRDFYAAGIAFLASSAVAVAGLVIVFGRSGDLGKIVPILKQNQQELEAHPGVHPTTSAARIDALTTISHWTGGSSGETVRVAVPLAILGLAAVVLGMRSRTGDVQGAMGPAGLVIILSVLLCIYHLFYDAMPLWIPVMSLYFAPQRYWQGYFKGSRRMLLGLLCLPIVNIFCTQSFKSFLDGFVADHFPSLAEAAWTVGCTASGVSLMLAFLLVGGQEMRQSTNAGKGMTFM